MLFISHLQCFSVAENCVLTTELLVRLNYRITSDKFTILCCSVVCYLRNQWAKPILFSNTFLGRMPSATRTFSEDLVGFVMVSWFLFFSFFFFFHFCQLNCIKRSYFLGSEILFRSMTLLLLWKECDWLFCYDKTFQSTFTASLAFVSVF